MGDIFTYKDVTIKVLWPDLKNTNVDYSNINNLSIVLFVDYGDFEALLTGDAESEVLDQIDLTDVVPAIQNGLDVYKVPHHGASNGLSLKLLNQLKPKNCVISVGANNKYGHPSPKTIKALESILCKVYRTDEVGDVTFVW